MSNIINHMRDIMASMNMETNTATQIWMLWMGLVFMASVIFIWRRMPARIVFLAMIATVASVLYIWTLTKNVHLFGVAHLLIWFPLAIYLWFSILSKKAREKYREDRTFYMWIWLLCATIIVSLIFDVRDIYLVMMDLK